MIKYDMFQACGISAEGDGAAGAVGETPKTVDREREELRRQAQERRTQQRKAIQDDLRLSSEDDELSTYKKYFF